MPDDRSRFLELFKSRAVLFGDFTLSSGQKSRFYINSKLALFHSECAWLLGRLIYAATADLEFDALGGMEVGAIPMATAALACFHEHGRKLEGFFVRKQVKDHGSRFLIEGVLKAGDRVVILDDVLTTGASALRAAEVVEAAGAKVSRVVCLVDRLQGAAEALHKYDFRPLYTLRDLGIEPGTAA
ncbi:MAG: orotate phosphoribosyltransferase [Gemmataceae bacterium]|nr:orotate phosphoribosyltransferase [Gemmataceae bacterium]